MKNLPFWTLVGVVIGLAIVLKVEDRRIDRLSDHVLQVRNEQGETAQKVFLQGEELGLLGTAVAGLRSSHSWVLEELKHQDRVNEIVYLHITRAEGIPAELNK